MTTVEAPASHLQENPFELAQEQLRKVGDVFKIDPNLIDLFLSMAIWGTTTTVRTPGAGHRGNAGCSPGQTFKRATRVPGVSEASATATVRDRRATTLRRRAPAAAWPGGGGPARGASTPPSSRPIRCA